jgi:large subunit ribosomal protein L23
MNAISQKKTRREKRKDAGAVIVAPRITEKGVVLAEKNAYLFTVAPSANKHEIARAIESLFKVKPIAVRVVRSTGKRSWTRGTNRWGRSAQTKKAYVYLKKGDTIEIS